MLCFGYAQSVPDEGSLSAEANPSPGSISLRSISPPSPTRGEGEWSRIQLTLSPF